MSPIYHGLGISAGYIQSDMDPDERERFGDGLNALHDLVTDLAGMVRFHETASERADWTAQEWREYELVAANID